MPPNTKRSTSRGPASRTRHASPASGPAEKSPFLLPVRVTVADPVPGVRLAMRTKTGALIEPVRSARRAAVFDVELRVATDGRAVRLLGPLAHGAGDERFLSVGVGTFAGQADSPWERRVKIPLKGLTRPMIDAVRRDPSQRIEALIAGRGKDGGPACATVPVSWRTRDADTP